MHPSRPLLMRAAALSLVIAGVLLAAPAPVHGQETATAIGIDANPSGNTATSLGRIDSCVQVSSGETFQVDIFIQDVTDLLAWEAYLETDPDVVRVIDRDVEQFQADNPGSDVLDGSGETPDDDGLYRLSAVDTADPPAPDSGSGVLARITLEALDRGTSPLRLALRDLDEDGTPDQGPFLRNVDAEIIGDDSGDTLFDGPISNAQVSVDNDCPGSDGDGLDSAIVIGLVVGGIAVIALIALAVLIARRRRATT